MSYRVACKSQGCGWSIVLGDNMGMSSCQKCGGDVYIGAPRVTGPEESHPNGKETSNGLTARYYELPEGATELYHLIIDKDMNAQLGEIFRACYRYGQVEHSAKLRDINKILAYAAQEKERLLKYELSQQPGG